MAYDYDRRTDTRLRKAVIRLAHDKPELQPHLLPLLKTATFKDLKRLIKGSLRAIKPPWEATLVKASSKETPAGEDSEFWVAVKPPRQRGVTFSETVQLSPTFKFYVTEIKVGPKAGTYYLQSIRVFIKPERLHRLMVLRSAKEVAAQVGRLLGEHGYEQLTY